MERFLLATDAVLLIEIAIVANASKQIPKKKKKTEKIERKFTSID